MQFSDVFKGLCKEAGVTQKQALSDMSLGRNTTQRWSTGWPSYETMLKISNYFNVPLDTLMKNEEKPTAETDDGLSDDMRKLKAFVSTVPPERAAYALKLLRTALEED